ncbi:alanine racemase [Fulvivirga sediminis]|uniref:Alanine racemase n=1 Tax=Fulvivirga sediminis TaxID=2803949 RepID=A0A937F7H2_9BACT|nr:alanine racemase [Fulvivirga sediminis]MBL3655740.1 alanine racemase [Fulvivirga sediminis]
MHDTSFIMLDYDALSANIDFIKSHLRPGVKLSSVIKGNAYGHGIREMVPLLQKCGVDHFSVFSAVEAQAVHKITGADCTIMIMGHIHDHDIEWAIKNKIEFFVFDYERGAVAIDIAKKIKQTARIHVELETGFNRTGFNKKDLLKFIKLIKTNKEYLQISGVCTHYAGAESVANFVRVKKQINKYNKLCKLLSDNGLETGLRHTACSAAAMAYPKTQMDMVRIGILQYGFWPSKEILIDHLSKSKNADKQDPLKRVITWSSSVMSLKDVKTGDFIGYGTSFLAHHDMRVAIVPVGYAHGYGRALSNHGRVLVKGNRVGVVGMVNMNMMMIDITGIPEVERGTPVILIGEEDNVTISVASFGEMSNQLNYELLTRLPLDIPRLIK